VTSNDTPVVEASGLTKTYGADSARVEALRGIDLVVRRGEFVAVMGPSGSGKSTLLHLIGGLDAPTSGRIRVGGEDLSALDDDRLTLLRRRRIGFIFQAFNLIDVLTAEENVALPLVLDGISEAETQRRARAALDLVDLTHRRGHVPGQLSGGEQQRLAIARALVARPLLLLADEPTGNLDSDSGEQVTTLLRNLADQQQQTILMVTHDARHAARADRLLRLRDGRIVDEQPLERGRPLSEVLADLEA
jgi:putative ABC transport system ATP-binding protein